MANQNDYLAKLECFKAIPDENTLVPSQPIDSYLQESENLYHWALDDLVDLKKVGINKKQLDDLPVRAGACREAQSIWNKDYRSQKDARKQWNTISPAAYELRDMLLHTFRFAFRKDATLISRVTAISQGNGHADMIQDLNDLAVLGKENTTLLKAVSFDLSELDTTAAKADTLASLLAEANGDKAEQNESKLIRDKAYTHLKEFVDELRAAGKYLFWKDKTRYKGYTSTYWKNKKRSKDTEKEPETSASE